VLGALVAALVSFAHAKPVSMPHGGGFQGGVRGGYSQGGYTLTVQQDPRTGGRWYGVQMNRGLQPDRNVQLTRAPNADYGQPPRTAGSDRTYRPGGADAVRYAGAITPVSTEGRPAPRPPANAPVVRGSLRADVAHYNEERGAARPIPRPPDEAARPQSPSPYRN
jgi:hypothetical protein